MSPRAQTSGERGTLEVLQQLQGFETPASAGAPTPRSPHHPARPQGPGPSLPDRRRWLGTPFAASGDARAAPDAGRRVTPTSVAPVTFFVRDEASG
jgi:ATP-dependent Lhr-like helicase